MDINYINTLMNEIRTTTAELKQAQEEFDFCDDDMIDAGTYKIKYLTAKYTALNRRLKNIVFEKPKKDEKIIKKVFTFLSK